MTGEVGREVVVVAEDLMEEGDLGGWTDNICLEAAEEDDAKFKWLKRVDGGGPLELIEGVLDGAGDAYVVKGLEYDCKRPL